MFSYWVEIAVSAGLGVLISLLKKVKIFHFSCMLVIDFTVKLTFKLCSPVINGENHVKSHQKSSVFFAYEML